MTTTDIFFYQKIDRHTFDVKKAIKHLYDIVIKNHGIFDLYNGEKLESLKDLNNLDYLDNSTLSTVVYTPRIYTDEFDGDTCKGYIEFEFRNYANEPDGVIDNLISNFTAYKLMKNHKKLFHIENFPDENLNKLAKRFFLTIALETRSDIGFIIRMVYEYMQIYPQSFIEIDNFNEVLFIDDLEKIIEYADKNKIDLSYDYNFINLWRDLKDTQKSVNIINWDRS